MNPPTKASLLIFFFSLCATALLVTMHLRKHTPPPAPHELYSVVNRQLAAFRADDFPSAYRQAASAVQTKFTLAQFEAMIRRDYAQMAHARRVEFGPVNVHGSAAIVQVYFFAADGSVRSFLYSLMAERGAWKIDGAEEVRVSPRMPQLSGSHA